MLFAITIQTSVECNCCGLTNFFELQLEVRNKKLKQEVTIGKILLGKAETCCLVCVLCQKYES